MTRKEAIEAACQTVLSNDFVTPESSADFERVLAEHGYVVVPKEPTEAMLHRGGAARVHPSVYMGGVPEMAKLEAKRIYRAMITATRNTE